MCLNHGIVIYGVPAISPDGKYILTCIKNLNEERFIGIVDLEHMEIIASLPTDIQAFFGFAFSDDSKYAFAQCCDYSPPIIYLDGANSSIKHNIPVQYFVMSAAFNPLDGLFYALQNRDCYSIINPETGEILETINTEDQFQFNIKIDKNGNPAALSVNNLFIKMKSIR